MMKGKIVGILICILMVTTVVPIGVSALEINDSPESLEPIKQKVIYVTSAWAQGNASSGKQIGIYGLIGIINFDYVRFDRIRFNPIRWEMVDFTNVKVIVFWLSQDIPSEGPFDFERDWVSAIVIG